MVQTKQLSDLIREAEELVAKVIDLPIQEQRTLTAFLSQRLGLAEGRKELQRIKEKTEQDNRPWSGKSILQLVDDLNAEIPPEVLEQQPHDGAEEHDHYIYGTPKKSDQLQ